MSTKKIKRKSLPKNVGDMSKEMLAETLRKKRECNARALLIVETMLESVTVEYFLSSLQHINQSHFQDIIEERALLKYCGYPLCSNQLSDIPNQKYHISNKLNKVYDMTERKYFCSNTCYKAASYIKQQLLTSPLWLRDVEKIPDFKLFTSSTHFPKSGIGEEVSVSLTVDQEVDYQLSKSTINTKVYENDQKESEVLNVKYSEIKSSLDSDIMSELSPVYVHNETVKKEDSDKIPQKTDVVKEKIRHAQFSEGSEIKHEMDEKKKESDLKVSLVEYVEKCIIDWVQVEALNFLFQKQIEHCLKATSSCHSTVNSEKYANIFNQIDILKLEDFCDKTIKYFKPLPNYSELKKESEKRQVKVSSFYKGVLESEDTKDEDEETSSKFVMPIVDSHAQNVLRKKIVVDRLISVIPHLLSIINPSSLIETSYIRELVSHFTLRADNITFKPASWNLVGLIIIKMLSLQSNHLHMQLQQEESQQKLTSILKIYQLDASYLDSFMEKIRIKMNE